MPSKKEQKIKPSALRYAEKGCKRFSRLLDELYPAATCSLDFANPLELLVATVLSAQCTDERVNLVTPELFTKYPTARDYAQAPLEDLENDIRSTGFYHNKAKSIKAMCQILDEQLSRSTFRHDLDTLVQLPGIGRKTANVILGNAYQIPGVVVDTHVGRVAQRLGLTARKTPTRSNRTSWLSFPESGGSCSPIN